MKYIIVLVTVFALNSCNTLIGMGRDTKQGYYWTKDKIQRSNSSSSKNQGAPVY